MCNVPIQLNEEVLAAFLSTYGDIEEVTKAKSPSGTAHGDYLFTMCLDRVWGYGHTTHSGLREPGNDGGRWGSEAPVLELQTTGAFLKMLPSKDHQNYNTDNNNSDDNDNISSSDFGDHNANKRKPPNWGPPGQGRRGLDPGTKRGGRKKTPLNKQTAIAPTEKNKTKQKNNCHYRYYCLYWYYFYDKTTIIIIIIANYKEKQRRSNGNFYKLEEKKG